MNLSLTHEWHNWVVDLFDWTITPHEISFEQDWKREWLGQGSWCVSSDSQWLENNDLQVLIQGIDRSNLFGKYVDYRIYHRCCCSFSRFQRSTHDSAYIERERERERERTSSRLTFYFWKLMFPLLLKTTSLLTSLSTATWREVHMTRRSRLRRSIYVCCCR